MSIGSRIKSARKEKGMTQEYLASLIGVTKGAIANYENEVSVPKIELLYKLMDTLNVDANYLYQDEMKNFKITPRVNTFSAEATEVAEAYDNAPFKDKNMARMALNLPLLETEVKAIKDSGNKGEQAG